jgi:predicted transglutaminase-like cysteine proteinase
MVRRALGSGDRTVTRERIAAINAWTNGTVRYVEDRDLYGQADYWASARTTLKRRAGDCEDIAIAKMQLLAAMGVPRSDMYLTIARDLARNADHAMLVVRFEGEHLLLDNATDEVLDASGSYDYRPILSFNTAQKWLHGY